eukprot:1157711-Pelagomonas_calceolata.AAC.19
MSDCNSSLLCACLQGSHPGVNNWGMNPLIFRKPNDHPTASFMPSSRASNKSQAVAEAVADGRGSVPLSSGSAGSFSGKPSPQSKLDVLLRLQGGMKSSGRCKMHLVQGKAHENNT